ncbi:PAS domain-containing protein [Belnapia sp. F-4-1]|uniref:PAS domain-containing protein n=1 Tax=Belnapia sp. F-4-1 TaxID=1545443 RepID=UPI000690A82F|nr:PAS domain-containing protein [Belnapia sp. F-4-1]
MLALAGGAVWQQNRAERLRVEEGLVARAYAMALLLDREFAGAERLLHALSRSPALARGDLPTFWSEMRSAATAFGAQAVNLVGPDGRMRLSTSWAPDERRLPMSTGPAVEALATWRTVVGNLFVSPSVGKWSVAVAVPFLVPDPAGTEPVRYVLGLVMPRERLLSTLTEQRLPPGSVASALDRELTTVARTSRDREALATKPSAEVQAALGAEAGMIGAYTALEGERVRAAYALAPQSGFRVKVTVPEAAFEASLRQALLPTLLIGAGLLSVTLVFSVLFANRLAGSLRRLGDPGLAGAPAGAAVREIDELGALLARRAEAREAAAAEARALFETSPVGVVRSDAGGRVTAANAAFLRIVGMTGEDLAAGRIRWDDLTPPEWIGRDEAAIAEAARNGACAPYQKEYVRPDGTRVPVLMFFAFHDRAVGATSAFVVDLSGWEATEAALAHAHERMHLAMGAARIFSWDWNVVTGAVQWSGGLEAALGMSEASFGGTVDDFRALVHEDDLPRVEAALRRALADEAPYDIEFRMRRADGGERWVVTRGTVLRDGTGRPTRMIGIDFDITDRKRAELALAESQAALRRVTEAGRVATYEVKNPGTGGEAEVSPGFRELYGLPPDARCDFAAVLARVHPEDRDVFLAEHRRLAAQGGRFDTEFRVVLPGGDVRWIQTMGEAEPGPDGMPARLCGVAFDVTKSKAAEAALVRVNAELEVRVTERTRALSEAAEELRAEIRRREETQTALVQAQKLEALGQLTGSVAHDFNNVLAAVMGSLRLIARRAGGNQQILNLARGGEQAAERAAALVRQLSAFARREDVVPVVVRPVRVLEEIDEMLRRSVGSGIALSLGADPDAWPILTDPHRLEIALLNLVVNARDAMEGAGSLVVAARNAAASPDRDHPEGLDPNQDYVVASVRDSGPGMAPEVLARASEPFFTTKPRGQGTGLGLAMVHEFARQSGGVLRLLSAPGEGTTAEIWLPRAAASAAVPAVAAEADPSPALHGPATVLVVDDDDHVRLVMTTQLRDLGYEVIEANSLASAMAQASATAQLDLVVTDITMPGGRGPDLALRLRSVWPGVPILFVSGYRDAAALVSEVVLAKPFTQAELSRRVLAALGRLPSTPHETMLMRLSRPELRGIYLAWCALRSMAGGDGLPSPEALDLAGHAGAEHAFTVALEEVEQGEPRLRFVSVGAALAQRLGRPLEGEQVGGDLETDEAFSGLDDAYRRCTRLGAPSHDCARQGWGGGGEPLCFERLVLPLAADGGCRPTHLVGLAFFFHPA